MRFKFWDLILYSLLFFLVVSFPLQSLGISDPYIIYGLGILLRFLLIAFYIWTIKKSGRKLFNKNNVGIIALLAPCFVVCFTNVFSTFFDKSIYFQTISSSNIGLFLMVVMIDVETAILEEIVFRYFIHSSLDISQPLKKILASAGIFALAHLLNLVNVRSVSGLVTVLIQTAYTFGIGIILGFIYQYSGSLLTCMIFHFLFNFFNTTFYGNFFVSVGGRNEVVFYITAGVIAGLVAIYLLVVYFVKLRKENYYNY